MYFIYTNEWRGKRSLDEVSQKINYPPPTTTSIIGRGECS
jgi:hypothetical protein